MNDPVTILAKERTASLGEWDVLPLQVRAKALDNARRHIEEVQKAVASAEQVGGGQGGD